MSQTGLKVRFRARRRGFVMITMVLSMVALLSFVGLAVDVGYIQLVKTRMQTAADAAALGAVQELRMNGAANIVAAARADAAINGFTHGAAAVTVAVNRPPASGSYTGNQTAVEVIISQDAPTFFMQVLGLASMTVRARGVARQSDSTTCVYVLNPSATKALSKTGSGDFISPCGVFVNSSDPKALYTTGSGKIDTTPGGTAIVGSFYLAGSGTISPAPVTDITRPPILDPLANRTPPALPGTCDYTNFSTSAAITLHPGVYCGGISLTGSNPKSFDPGLYIMNGGGLNIAGSGGASGSGVTIYLTADASHTYKGVSINGSGNYTFSAPTSGAYEAMLLIGDATRASPLGSTITGSTNLTLDGVIYLPKEALTFTGSGTAANYQVLVSDTLTLAGSGHLYNNYTSLASGAPVKAGGMISE